MTIQLHWREKQKICDVINDWGYNIWIIRSGHAASLNLSGLAQSNNQWRRFLLK